MTESPSQMKSAVVWARAFFIDQPKIGQVFARFDRSRSADRSRSP